MTETPNRLTGAARAHAERLIRQSLAARRDAEKVQQRMLTDSLKRKSRPRRAER